MNNDKIIALITASRFSSYYILNGFCKIHEINVIILATFDVLVDFDTHTCAYKFSAFLLISKHLRSFG